MTHAESLAVLAEIAENNLDTNGAVWIVNPANAATLGSTAKDSGSGQFVYQDGRILGRRVISKAPMRPQASLCAARPRTS